MKNVLAIILLVAISATAFPKMPPTAKLYPALTKYFNSLSPTRIDKSNISTLDVLRNSALYSSINPKETQFIFLCPDNSLRSQAAQVFLTTLSTSKKLRKLKVYSAGQSAGEVDTSLIGYLNKIGYKTSKTTIEGKTAYEVKYSDDAPAITLFAKTCDNAIIPLKETIPVSMCSLDAASWQQWKFGYPVSKLPLEDPKTIKSQVAMEEEIDMIANYMTYITNDK